MASAAGGINIFKLQGKEYFANALLYTVSQRGMSVLQFKCFSAKISNMSCK